MESDKWFASHGKLGILGGGQLGKMLLEEAIRLDITVAVMDPASDCACASLTPLFQVGSLMDEQAVLEFGRSVEVLTIEIEHVHTGALFQLEKEGIKVFPPASVIARIQDKGTQKEFYSAHSLPTAPYQLASGVAEVKQLIYSESWTLPLVWKSRKGGYDGRGVKVLRSIEEIDQLPDVPCYLEALVPIATEIACVGARSESGEIAIYPPVGMHFHPEANQVEEVFVPSDSPNDILEQCTSITSQLLQEQQHVGLLAVEFLLAQDGQLLVNEMAPRPHNSGHIFSDTAWTSQFEQHLRAIMDLPLGSTQLRQPGVMINLVGEEGYQGPVFYHGAARALAEPGVYLHLYGKKDTRPFRKMGHVNVVARDLNEAFERAKRVRSQMLICSTTIGK